jgi:hypothetical protein
MKGGVFDIIEEKSKEGLGPSPAPVAQAALTDLSRQYAE